MANLARLIPQTVKRAVRGPLERRFGKVEMTRPYELVIDPSRQPLVGHHAVVTGASGAIGRAISIRLAAEGARVTAVARDTKKLEELVEEIESLGGTASWQSLDLNDAEAVRSIAERLGHVDVLVNNAGGSSRAKNAYVWEQTAETIDEVLSVNLRSAMLTTGAFGRGMVERGGGGRIVNLGSTVAAGGLSKFSEYAAAKAGVVGYTRSAALELGPHGVTVNCVAPGIVQRDQISHAKVEATLKKGVLPDLGRPEDIAQMVGFLVGPHAGWITGQEFIVDGGRSIGLHGEF